jgi:hypothetical protein
MFNKINVCGYCQKEFTEEEPVLRWITSNIQKVDFSDAENFKYIYPYHYECINNMMEKEPIMQNLTSQDLEAGPFNIISKNTEKHIQLATTGYKE